MGTEETPKTGRPSIFSQEIASRICERIADGESLRAICADADMPSRATVRNWLADPRHSVFLNQYARAREEQADTLFEEIMEIADRTERDYRFDAERGLIVDGEHIQRAKLMVDTRKWMAGKLAPKKYGEKTFAEVEGTVTHKVLTPDAAREKVAAFLDRAKQDPATKH